MNNKILNLAVAIVVFFVTFCFSQVELGVGFTPYVVDSSTITKIDFKDDDEIEKIIKYFYKKEDTYTITASTDTELINSKDLLEVFPSTETISNNNESEEDFVVVDGSSTFTIEQLKRLFYGLGRLEIIRLLMIKQKVKDTVDFKTLVEYRRQDKPLKEIANKYGIVDYINEIWLPSKEIYDNIFNEGR